MIDRGGWHIFDVAVVLALVFIVFLGWLGHKAMKKQGHAITAVREHYEVRVAAMENQVEIINNERLALRKDLESCRSSLALYKGTIDYCTPWLTECQAKLTVAQNRNEHYQGCIASFLEEFPRTAKYFRRRKKGLVDVDRRD